MESFFKQAMTDNKVSAKSATIICYGLSENVGDTAILEGTLSFLSKQGISYFNVPCFDEKVNLNAPERVLVERFEAKNPFSMIYAVKSSDIGILGGGGIIQVNTSILNLVYFLGFAALFLIAKKPVIVHRVGVHEIPPRLARAAIRFVFNRCKSISVRDKRSKVRLEEMGVVKPIQVKCDPAFDRVYSLQNVRPVIKNLAIQRYILFSLRAPRREVTGHLRSAEARYTRATLAEMARDFAYDTRELFRELECVDNTMWLFISAHFPRDFIFTRELVKVINPSTYEVLDMPITYDEIEFLARKSVAVVSGRLHSCIAAIKSDVHLVAIGNEKIEDILCEYEWSEKSLVYTIDLKRPEVDRELLGRIFR